jgi:hypothetical protein
MPVAGGLRYQTGREMPPGMQELYGVKLAAEMLEQGLIDPALKEQLLNGIIGEQPQHPTATALYRREPYIGKAPDRADLPECPFCGSENLLIDQDSEGWFVECNGCMAEGPRAPTQDEAERRWSIRR